MGKSTSSRSSKNDEKSTLLNSKGWQKHWVNHTPFTVFIFTFAVACFAGALLAATTLVSGSLALPNFQNKNFITENADLLVLQGVLTNICAASE
jgi:hypothetical protein